MQVVVDLTVLSYVLFLYRNGDLIYLIDRNIFSKIDGDFIFSFQICVSPLAWSDIDHKLDWLFLPILLIDSNELELMLSNFEASHTEFN